MLCGPPGLTFPEAVVRKAAAAMAAAEGGMKGDMAMRRMQRALIAVFLVLLVLASAGCSKLKARDQLNRGVQAYKNARYEEAIEHFKTAVSLDPELINARLYLATAYAQQYVPGAETKENMRYAEQAIEEYKKVLDVDASNVLAVKGAANLYLQQKRFTQARELFDKALEIDSSDPEAYYSIAYIDWSLAYDFRQNERTKLGMKDPTAPLRDKKACEAVRKHNSPLVEEGIGQLTKALELRPDFDDAMAYMNLMYRERADYECADADARKADLKTADDWVEKTLATKREKANRKEPGGIVLNPKKEQ
jgi:tetratricopeptide (TPR) repeat protein